MKIIEKITLILYSNIILIMSVILCLLVFGWLDANVVANLAKALLIGEKSSGIILGVSVVFIEKYLKSMGFNVNNDMFKDKSLYFRNALVRSNYGNIPKGIYPTFDYLVMFFENLLQGKNNELKNKELYVKNLFD